MREVLLAETAGTIGTFAEMPADVLLLGGSKGLPFLKPALDALAQTLPAQPARRVPRPRPRRLQRRQQHQPRRRQARDRRPGDPPLLQQAVIPRPLTGTPCSTRSPRLSLVQSCLRTWSATVGYVARIAGRRPRLRRPTPTLYVGAMFHDLGLSAAPRRFEVGSADAARDFLRARHPRTTRRSGPPSPCTPPQASPVHGTRDRPRHRRRGDRRPRHRPTTSPARTAPPSPPAPPPPSRPHPARLQRRHPPGPTPPSAPSTPTSSTASPPATTRRLRRRHPKQRLAGVGTGPSRTTTLRSQP